MTLYDQILSLPMFQGLSREDLDNIVTHTKFDFSKVEPGLDIVRENTPCTHLRFLLSGTVVIHSRAVDNSYSVDEDVQAPAMFGLERLFGLTQYHGQSITALTQCSLLNLRKDEIMTLADGHLIFRMNLFNRLATDTQKYSQLTWRRRPMTLVGGLLEFLSLHTSYPAGHKVLNIRMQTLADEIGQSRLNVSRQLNAWKDSGLVALSRGRIDIPQLEKLLQLKDCP